MHINTTGRHTVQRSRRRLNYFYIILFFYTRYISAYPSELFYKACVSAFYMVYRRYLCNALCCESGKHHSCACSEVCRYYLRALKLFIARYDSAASFYRYAGAHTVELVDMHISVFKNSLDNSAASLNYSKERHELRLHVSRESRIRQR